MSLKINQLKKAFIDRSVKVGVIGLGYVGMPLSLTFVQNNFKTIGFDIDRNKITTLMSGDTYLSHISAEEISQAITDGMFSPTDDFSRISEVGVIFICVPTPLNKNQKPDLQFIISTGKLIKPHIQKNQIIIFPDSGSNYTKGI